MFGLWLYCGRDRTHPRWVCDVRNTRRKEGQAYLKSPFIHSKYEIYGDRASVRVTL